MTGFGSPSLSHCTFSTYVQLRSTVPFLLVTKVHATDAPGYMIIVSTWVPDFCSILGFLSHCSSDC